MADLTRKGAAELIDMLTKANQAGKGSKKSNPRRNTGISHFEHIRKKPKRYGRIKVEVMGYKQGEYYLVAYTPYLIGEGKRTISDTTRYDKKYRTKAQANEAAKKLRAFIRGGGDYKSLAAMKKVFSNPKRKNSGHTDEVAIREILLSTQNDGTFYESVLKPIEKNLGRHMYRGNFTRAGAMKSFKRVADLADKFYASSYSEQRRGTWMGRKGFLLSSNDRKKLAAEFLENRMYSIESYADELQAGVKYQDLNNNPSHGMTQSSSTPYRTGKLAFDDSRDTALRHIPSHKHRSYRDIKVGSAKVADKSFKKTIVPL